MEKDKKIVYEEDQEEILMDDELEEEYIVNKK